MVKRALLAVLLATAGISFAYAETPEETEPLSVPAGTMLHCRTTKTLTTKLNSQGDAFTINVAEPVSVNGRVVVPVGSTLAGRITLMARPGRIKGVGQMRLTVEQITLPDGRSFPLAATLMTAYGVANVKVVGSEGLVKGPNSHAPDFEEIGAGTAGGAVLGLIFAHPVIGATVGFTATTVDRMRRRGKDLTIPVGTQLNYQLTRELAIGDNASRATAANQVHSAGE
jgi:type IV secretion system protein VirB10